MIRDGLYWAEQLKKKKISFEELLTAIEQRVQQENPQVNALITFAKEEASKQFIASNKLDETPFAGLPLPLKMLGQDKKGWLSTSANRLLQTNRASVTDHFVQRLENAGMIPVGQTNAPEFGFKNVTDPVLYGDTRNPWNLDYSPGGSSGGAAASVASGMFPIAAASDGGGSIRIPASFSGLIGLKPTRGTMPVGPAGFRAWQGAAIAFALTISMRDTQTLFYALRGTETAAPYQAPKVEWNHTTSAHKKRLKIGFFTTSPVGSEVSTEAKTAVQKAVTFLNAQGHNIEEISLSIDGKQLMRTYYHMNGAETAAMMEELAHSLGRLIQKDEMELMSWGLYQYGLKQTAASYIHNLDTWDQAAAQMEHLFESYDLILTPATAHPAPKITDDLQSDEIRNRLEQIEGYSVNEAGDLIYEMFDESLRLSPFTQLANLTGQPAISLPTHVTDENLPLGIQFMAAKGREDLLFEIGKIFEENQQFHLPAYYQ
ncbi:amidase [Tetragenococcus koreensis]|uniref:Amidase n=1 Tax=Tetragenococcus koreensis TaxID=290335 RepID=A0AAN4RIF2_9ENTE|nr:amidase [Tetragenococcus koreensis]GEQ50743.1 amidase [Tetragenococcus koreensis]GEQ53196.1 amidase [Tetragenococcus koreensis]GEQ55744.1 amidase [Tetragenococcus koreensis]GEQ58201.1 amidase [Tetragenococcus koreensis]